MFLDRTKPGFRQWELTDLEPGQLVTLVTTSFSGTAQVVRLIQSTTPGIDSQVEIRPRDAFEWDGTPVRDDLYYVTPYSITGSWVKPKSYREARDMTR